MVVVMYAFAYISANNESRIPRFAQRLVRKIFVHLGKQISCESISSFNRNGTEQSSTSTSQAPHHLMRGPLRETYNPKSSSLSAASNSSSTQQQQQQQSQVSKIPEKLKCVFYIYIRNNEKLIYFPLSSIIIK